MILITLKIIKKKKAPQGEFQTCVVVETSMTIIQVSQKVWILAYQMKHLANSTSSVKVQIKMITTQERAQKQKLQLPNQCQTTVMIKDLS